MFDGRFGKLVQLGLVVRTLDERGNVCGQPQYIPSDTAGADVQRLRAEGFETPLLSPQSNALSLCQTDTLSSQVSPTDLTSNTQRHSSLQTPPPPPPRFLYK